MKRQACHRQIAIAERHFADADAGLQASTAILRARLGRHGPLAVLGAGAIAGAIAGRLPLGGIVHVTRTLTSVGLFLLRVPFGLWTGAHARRDQGLPAEPTR